MIYKLVSFLLYKAFLLSQEAFDALYLFEVSREFLQFYHLFQWQFSAPQPRFSSLLIL